MDKTSATIKIFLCICIFLAFTFLVDNIKYQSQFYIAWLILSLPFPNRLFSSSYTFIYTNFKIIQVCFSNYFHDIIIESLNIKQKLSNYSNKLYKINF